MNRDKKPNKTVISVVAPCYFDAQNVPELIRRLNNVSEEMKTPFEIIIVDDGSPDNAWEVIKEQSKQIKNISGIKLSRNFGQHLAITAGIAHTTGDYVLIMDGDLQDLPEEIPKLYNKICQGYDIVFSVRKKRADNKLRFMFSLLYRYFINKMSGLKIPYNISMMRMLTREFANHYLRFTEKRRTLGALFVWMGFKQTYVHVNHGSRFSGKSNFTVLKLIVQAVNDISSFSTLPIALIGYLGVLISSISFFFGLFIIIRYFFADPPTQPGWSSIICAISFSTGMVMLSFSIIGKYIANIFYEVLDRPLYFIAEKTSGAKVLEKGKN
jgi:dolichol-phosphate mannosyltransferase